MKLLTNIALWFEYNHVYQEIQKNPRARAAMQKDPGYKFMRRGWWIVFAILAIMAYCGMK